MSTDRQRLKSAIQRIAESSPAISEAIGASKNKGGQASSTGVGVSDAERDNLCCNGTTGGGANAGSDTRDPDEDGEDGLDDTDPADLSMGQGSLTGVTDCATGEPLCFNGGGFIPPDGWDDALTPPVVEEFQEGFFWQTGVPAVKAADPRAAALADLAQLGLCGNITNTSSSGDPPTDYRFGFSCPDQETSGYIIVIRQDCDGADEEESYCTEVPFETSWPEDSCTNLAIYGGKIVGSKYDPENDGSYSAPRDELEVCDSSGNRILLRGSPTGGWKSIKSLSGDIDPGTGNGYLYRPSGQKVRQISPSEFRDDTV